MDIQKAHDLADVREQIEEKQIAAGELEQHLQEIPEFARLTTLRDEIAALRKKEAVVKEYLAAELVAAYHADGTTKFPGIGDVAIRKAVNYDDAPAIKWAISAGMHALLTVKRKEADKAFEGLADNLDFVTVETVPFARIASELKLTPF